MLSWLQAHTAHLCTIFHPLTSTSPSLCDCFLSIQSPVSPAVSNHLHLQYALTQTLTSPWHRGEADMYSKANRFSGSSILPFLKMLVRFLFFQSLRTSPDSRDFSNIMESSLETASANSFRTLGIQLIESHRHMNVKVPQVVSKTLMKRTCLCSLIGISSLPPPSTKHSRL